MSYNSGSNRARNFKSASRFALGRFRNYSPDYSLNCTPLGPITITNRNGDDDNDNNTILIRLQAELGYKRRPQTSTQKINLINTDFKCIILSHKPRAIFGLDGNNNNISK